MDGASAEFLQQPKNRARGRPKGSRDRTPRGANTQEHNEKISKSKTGHRYGEYDENRKRAIGLGRLNQIARNRAEQQEK